MQLALLSGALIGMAFFHAWLWWCAPVGIALLAHTIATSKTYREAILGCCIAGITKGLLVTMSLMNAYPMDWIGDVHRFDQFLFISFCWIGSGITTGVGYAVLGALAHAARKYQFLVRAVVFGAALVASEVAGSLLFSIYTLGSLGSPDANFGFGMSGFLLAEHYFLQSFAIVGGVYALSFVIGILGYSLFLLWPHTKLALMCAGIVCITSFIPGPHAWKSPEPIHTVAVVETSFGAYRTMSASELSSRQRALTEGVKVALAHGARVTALPEDARLGIGIEPEIVAVRLSEIPHADGAVVIDSYRTEYTSHSDVLRGFIYDLDRQRSYPSDKRYLVPVGEYMPWLHQFVVSLLDGSGIFEHMRYVRGDKTLDAALPDSVPTLLFCFESGATPLLNNRLSKRMPSLIVHPVSHAWFHEPLTLQNQERQMLIVQSIYTGIPILQAGNMAPSALYRPDGTVDYGTAVASGPRWNTILFTQ